MELFKLLGTIAVDAGDSLKTIDDTTSKAGSLGQKMQDVGGKVAGFGAKMTAVVGGAVVGAGTAMMSFATKTSATADNIDKMSQRLGLSREAFQELDFALSQSGVDINSFQTGMKSLLANMDKVSEGNKTAVANFEALGVAVVDDNGKMKDQETVLWDTISAFQAMENGAEKSRLAQELFGKQGQEIIPLLNAESGSIEEMKNMAHDLGLVMGDDAVDAGVEFTDKMDQMKRAMSATTAELGAKLLPSITKLVDLFIEKGVPALEKIIDKISSVVDWFVNLDSKTQKIILIIGGVVLAIGPLLTVIGTLISVGGTLIAIVGAISAPVLIVVGVIGALIAVGVLLYKNWDTIKAKAQELWKSITETFDKIKQSISDKINSAKDTVKNAIEKIKSFFKFEWSLPKLKMPHFKLEGSFSLNPPSVPKIGVDWYAKAMDDPMIMNQPTAFGINANGQIMAGGEAGSEVVSGTNTLMNMISTAVQAQNEGLEDKLSGILAMMAEYMPQMAQHTDMKMVLDTGALIGQIAPSMDSALGKLAIRNGRMA